MKKGWKIKRLAEVLELQNGYAFDSKCFNPTDGLPLIRIRSLKAGVENETRFNGEYDQKYVVKAGDLLIGMDGEFGCYDWKGEPALLNQRVCRLHGFSGELTPRFLFYGVNDYLKAIEDVTGYTTVKHISSKQILDIEFPVPPLAEQQRIVGLLDEAFEGLATAKANAEKNLQNARALFESHLQSVFTQRGPGWVEKPLGDLCSIARGGSPRPIQSFLTTASDGFNWVKIGDATASGKYIYTTEQKIIREGATRSRIVHAGDFLLSNSMSFGRPYIMQTTGCVHDGWLVLSDYASQLDQDYLYLVLGSQFMFQQFDRLAAGSTVRNLNIELASRVEVPVPPLKQQRDIAQHLDAISEVTQRLARLYERKHAALAALKKSLLHQAFTGAL